MSTVIGAFDSRSAAEQAVEEIREMGISEDEISIVGRKESFGEEEGEQGLEADETVTGQEENDLTTGTWTGGTLGGLAGIAAGVGAMAIPGIGPVVALGPIAAGLSGVAAGGIAGALIDMGIPAEEGEQYEEQVRQGRILAVVESDEDKVYDTAAVFRKNGADDVKSH